jgi:hypothetical protein
MRSVLFWLLAAAFVIGILLYRSRASRQLNVEPHATEEIEKAKRR